MSEQKVTQKPLGEILMDRGLIRLDQLETALREQERSHRLLGEILVDLNFLSPKQLYPILADIFSLPYVDLEKQIIPESFQGEGTPTFKPFAIVNDVTYVATGDPHNIFIQHEIQCHFPNHALFVADPALVMRQTKARSVLYRETNYQIDGSVIDLGQQILNEGIETGASDIHFLPYENMTKVLCRIDGLMRECQTFHHSLWLALKSHFKVLANLDLAENRRPQDGRFTLNHLGQDVDCRLSFIPTNQGESLVIRLLDQSRVNLDINALGFLEEQKEQLRRIAKQAQGLFIIAGPTGSGKTTTLYGLLKEINIQQKNIFTVEDPIEYQVPGIRQSEVKQGVNTFTDLLRAVLRHDPDVIYISEIRDFETAQTAVRAALTGHLVFSTIHASSSCLIPQRLRDLGVMLPDLSGTLLALMSQRLIRKICSHCDGVGTQQDHPCKMCHGFGYRGRQVIGEVLPCDDSFRAICEQDLSWKALDQWKKSLSCLTLEQLQRFYVTQRMTNQAEIDRVFGRELGEERLLHVA